MNFIMYGFEIMMKINKNIFCKVRFSVLKVFGIEAGIGFAVPLKTKEEDFIGKEELIKRKANPQKKLVGLELNGKEIAGHGDCVHIGRSQVGIVTSGCLSSTLNKNIALCRIDVQYSEIGTEVEIGKIDGHQKRIGAKVVGFPFYDPTKSRVRA